MNIFDLIKESKNDLLEKMLTVEPALVNAKAEQGISVIQFAAYCGNKGALVILGKFKQKPDIFESVCMGDFNTVSHLIYEKPDQLDIYSSDGFTPLGLASYFGHFNLAELLLKKGADPNVAANNSFKVTPLHSACAASKYDIAELLIKYGADVNAKQMQGVTALHSAAHNGNLELIKLLTDNGADVYAQMDNGKTPLDMAEEKGFTDIVSWLKNYIEKS